jgi:hypothetical protein
MPPPRFELGLPPDSIGSFFAFDKRQQAVIYERAAFLATELRGQFISEKNSLFKLLLIEIINLLVISPGMLAFNALEEFCF